VHSAIRQRDSTSIPTVESKRPLLHSEEWTRPASNCDIARLGHCYPRSPRTPCPHLAVVSRNGGLRCRTTFVFIRPESLINTSAGPYEQEGDQHLPLRWPQDKPEEPRYGWTAEAFQLTRPEAGAVVPLSDPPCDGFIQEHASHPSGGPDSDWNRSTVS